MSEDPSRGLPPTRDGQSIQLNTVDAGEWDDDTPGRETYRVSYDSSTESVCTAVVSAIATVSGEHSTEVGPLHSVINVDALEAVLDSQPSDESGSSISVTFTVDDCDVTVRETGLITVVETH